MFKCSCENKSKKDCQQTETDLCQILISISPLEIQHLSGSNISYESQILLCWQTASKQRMKLMPMDFSLRYIPGGRRVFISLFVFFHVSAFAAQRCTHSGNLPVVDASYSHIYACDVQHLHQWKHPQSWQRRSQTLYKKQYHPVKILHDKSRIQNLTQVKVLSAKCT